MEDARGSALALGGVTFHRPTLFWVGAASVITGVLLHFPLYLQAGQRGYRMAGMEMDMAMCIGMGLIVLGLALSLLGLLPRRSARSPVSSIRVVALDNAPITRTHVTLLVAMAFAVTIDIMKPTSLAFVIPGMTLEYGLKSPLNPSGTLPAAYLALAGITGTVFGSFIWGWLGDRIGRRASILFAGINFIATSICGTMPDYEWNLVMCFLMGLGVGGMLPIAYALLAETIPARHRGWVMVLVGADIAGAYILTSWLAAELIPTYSWRIMWLIGLPTGVLFIMMNRWIPESPRFLLLNGREAEARAIMEKFGAVVVQDEETPTPVSSPSRWRELMRGDVARSTLIVSTLGIGAGLVLFGFNLWIPSNLRKLGFVEADAMLRNSALIGFPLTFVIAWLYGAWSSKKTIIGLTALTAAALYAFALAGDHIVRDRTLLYVLLVIPIWGINSVIAVLSVYGSEIYPTTIRSKGTGLCAGASKAGGVLVIALVAFNVAPPSISEIALIGAVPMTIAVIAIALFGVETSRRRLEQITVRHNELVENSGSLRA